MRNVTKTITFLRKRVGNLPEYVVDEPRFENGINFALQSYRAANGTSRLDQDEEGLSGEQLAGFRFAAHKLFLAEIIDSAG